MRARKWGFLEHLFLFKKWLKRRFHFMSTIILLPLGGIWLWPLRGPAAIALILGSVSDQGEGALCALTPPFPKRLLGYPSRTYFR